MIDILTVFDLWSEMLLEAVPLRNSIKIVQFWQEVY